VTSPDARRAAVTVDWILQDAHLPSRAAGALVTLVTPLVVCVVLLVPGLSTTVTGVVVVAIGVVCGAALARLYPMHRLTGRLSVRGASGW
jgi:hypothetical protein